MNNPRTNFQNCIFQGHTGRPGPETLVGPQRDPAKSGKLGLGTLVGTLQKPECRDPKEILRKPKKRDIVPKRDPKSGKAGPNVTLENFCKSTFTCVPAQKATEFRKQNFQHFNLISFNLITTVSILKGHQYATKSAVELNSLLW